MIAYDQPYPARREAKTLIVTAALWAALAVCGYQVVINLTPWAMRSLLGIFSNLIVVATAAGQLVGAAVLFAVIVAYRLVRRRPLLWGVFGGSPKDFAIAGFGAVALVIGFQLWVHMSGVGNPPWSVAYVVDSGDSLPLVLLTSGFVAPLFEECLFRGVLLYAILKLFMVCNLHRFVAPGVLCVIAVIATSALFAILHGAQYTKDVLIYMFILGCWYGYLAIRVRSIAVPVFAHSVTGLVTIAILLATG